MSRPIGSIVKNKIRVGNINLGRVTCRGDLLDDRWIVHLPTLSGDLVEREIGDDALFGETFGRVDTDEDGKDQVRHANDRARLRTRARPRISTSWCPVRCPRGEFEFKAPREQDLFREQEDYADGVYHPSHRTCIRVPIPIPCHRIPRESKRGVRHVLHERPRTLVHALTHTSLHRLGEMPIVQRVGDVVRSAGCVEVKGGEVEMEREFDGLRADAVPLVGADGCGEVEGGERDGVGVGGVGGGGHE